MRRCFKYRFVLGVTLSVCGGFGLYGQAQTGSAHCRADGPRDDTGHPHCCADGSMPDGVNQCWCEPIIVRGDYRNRKHEYEVHVPDGIAEIPGCSGIGHGFQVSLDGLESGDGDYGMNQIAVSGTERSHVTFQEMIDAWPGEKTSSQNDDVKDDQLDEPAQTSLSFLPALHLKSVRTRADFGKIVCEHIIANNPHKNIVYSITLISPADQYEKNRKLFKELLDGFRYIPSGEAINQQPTQF